jgi:AraC-like DNA-binding protein
MRSSRTLHSAFNGLAAPSTQILDLAGPYQVSVRSAELFVQEQRIQKPPYNALLASTTHRRSVTSNCGLVPTGVETYYTLCGPIDTFLPVEKLASRVGMSPRNFARVFLKDPGTTPARFVELLRVEAARRRLEESRDKLDKIANDCGFESTMSLRRSFLHVRHVPATDYRNRFTGLRSKLN